ncbi:F-box/kelch-repeat protein At3g23880-like [Papaver somniferum]|uniref:F-box/kelch-repeat protein At3g23880-like n=1 Tax=Papaver somniferum TaxID=3469 RepID=UPI000E70478A|nr:F-box/kelch-repeat protein At3g23880-like [Papaver somniferum]
MDGNCGGNPPPNSLTEDLLIEILFWLPVASLLRFKTVRKNWCSIIGSSDFIHRHATFQNSTSKLGNFIFQYRPKHINHWDYKPYFFVLSSSSSRGSREDEEDYGQWSYKNLGMSPHLSDEDKYETYAAKYPPQANMVGSCHGIICIHHPHLRDVILWNPATKLFRCLPKSLPLLDEFGILQSEFVLFGFDCRTYDYKVVLITFFEIESVLDFTPKSKVQTYSLRSDSWKWKGFSHKRNEDAFWRSTVGLSFNFSSESFRKIHVPDDTCRLNVIGSDQGKIVYTTFVSNSTCEYISEVYEVYTMKDYDYSCTATNAENKKYSWIKLHRFTIDHPYGRYGPKAITKNGIVWFSTWL